MPGVLCTTSHLLVANFMCQDVDAGETSTWIRLSKHVSGAKLCNYAGVLIQADTAHCGQAHCCATFLTILIGKEIQPKFQNFASNFQQIIPRLPWNVKSHIPVFWVAVSLRINTGLILAETIQQLWSFAMVMRHFFGLRLHYVHAHQYQLKTVSKTRMMV